MRTLTVLIILSVIAVVSWAADEITLVANGKTIVADPPPVLHEGHVYVPLRAAAEAIGAKVEYDPSAKRVTVCRRGMCTMVWQSEGITVNGRLLIGIRQVAEALDVRVDWDGATKTVRITVAD